MNKFILFFVILISILWTPSFLVLFTFAAGFSLSVCYKSIIHISLFWVYYIFGDAYSRPLSDRKFDANVESQDGYLFHTLRSYENYLLQDWLRVYGCMPQKPLPLYELEQDAASMSNFFQCSSNKTKPVVFRKFLKESIAYERWSPQYFKQKYGEANVLAIERGAGFASKDSIAFTSFHQSVQFKEWKLRDVIDVMTNESDDRHPYINNVTSLFSQYPELVKEMDLNRLQNIDNSVDDEKWIKINMFMGGAKTGSSLHCAVAGNFFFNIYGQKRWTLIDPMFSHFLKGTPANDFSFVISGIDLENAPAEIQAIPKFEVILEPGDMLYIPPWWWHHVKNETPFTIACAVRDHTVYWQSCKLNPEYILMSPYIVTLHPWILKMVELWKGRKGMLKQSMTSDKDIVGHLSGTKIE